MTKCTNHIARRSPTILIEHRRRSAWREAERAVFLGVKVRLRIEGTIMKSTWRKPSRELHPGPPMSKITVTETKEMIECAGIPLSQIVNELLPPEADEGQYQKNSLFFSVRLEETGICPAHES